MEDEVGEHRALPRSAEREPLPRRAHLQRAEQEELHPHLRSSGAATLHRRTVAAQDAVSGSLALLAEAARTDDEWEAQMTRLDASTLGRLQEPLPVTTFPYVDSIEVEDATFDPDEPSPCLPDRRLRLVRARPGAVGQARARSRR